MSWIIVIVSLVTILIIARMVSNVPPIRMDVFAFCEGCGMYRQMTMTAYPDEITFRCKHNTKHVYRYLRADKLPDWFGTFAPPNFGEDDETLDKK